MVKIIATYKKKINPILKHTLKNKLKQSKQPKQSQQSKKSYKNKAFSGKNVGNELEHIIKLYYTMESKYDTYKLKKNNGEIKGDELTDIFFIIKYEIILHVYLIYKGYREMAEIGIFKLSDRQKDEKLLKMVFAFLSDNKLNYKFVDDKLSRKYIIYLSKSSNIPVDTDFGAKTADKLGSFYFCKSDKDKWLNYEWRIVITVFNIEILAQKCEKKEHIAANMQIVMDNYTKIQELLQELDSKKFGKKGNPITNSNNPIKIKIYKSL